MAYSRGTSGADINISDSSDSGNDYSTKVKLPILTRHNWYEWKAKFENLLISKGHEELLDPKWIIENSNTKRFRQKTALAIQILFRSVDRQLKGYMTPHSKDFSRAFQALKRACSEDSLIVIGDQVSQLVHHLFQPNSSIQDHSVAFQQRYLSLKETLDAQETDKPEEHIAVSSSLAAILFLKSFRLDPSLNSLIQLCHDIRPIRFDRVYDHLLAEDTRRENEHPEQAYLTTSTNNRRPPRAQNNQPRQANTPRPPESSLSPTPPSIRRRPPSSQGCSLGVVPAFP